MKDNFQGPNQYNITSSHNQSSYQSQGQMSPWATQVLFIYLLQQVKMNEHINNIKRNVYFDSSDKKNLCQIFDVIWS